MGTKTLTIRLQTEAFDEAVRFAEQNKTSLADLIRKALTDKLNGGVSLATLDEKLDKIIELAEQE